MPQARGEVTEKLSEEKLPLGEIFVERGTVTERKYRIRTLAQCLEQTTREEIIFRERITVEMVY